MGTKVWRVAKNEYLNIVRSKAFVIGIVLMPVLMGGAIVAQALLKDKKDTRPRRFAVVDPEDQVFPLLQRASQQRQEIPAFVAERSDATSVDLSDRVRAGEILAYVLVKGDLVGGQGEVAYHTASPTFHELPRWIRDIVNEHVHHRRFTEAGIDQGVVEKLSTPVPVQTYGLVSVSSSGEVKKAERIKRGAAEGVAIASLMLLFMLVMMAAPVLLNTVLEEKMQRIAEILVSSVSPFELFLGKLIGIVFVSWTLSTLYLGGVAYLVHHFGISHLVPTPIYFWFLFFQLMALLIFGSIFCGFGAAVSNIRDAQSLMMPIMVILMIPMFLWMPVVRNPDAPFAVTVSLIPPLTPFLMLLRVAVPPGPEAWELVVASVLTILFTLGCVWAAGKIFRVGVLAQGQTPSLRKLLSWIVAR